MKSSHRRLFHWVLLLCPCRTASLFFYLSNLGQPSRACGHTTKLTPGSAFSSLRSKDGPLDGQSTRALRQHEQLSVSRLEVQDAPPPASDPAADLHRGHELWRWSQWRSVPHPGWSLSPLWTLHSHRCIQVYVCSFTHTQNNTDTHTQEVSEFMLSKQKCPKNVKTWQELQIQCIWSHLDFISLTLCSDFQLF